MMMNGAENWMAAPSAPLLTRVCCLHHLTNSPRDWSRSWANELQPPFSSPVHLRRPTWLSSFIFFIDSSCFLHCSACRGQHGLQGAEFRRSTRTRNCHIGQTSGRLQITHFDRHLVRIQPPVLNANPNKQMSPFFVDYKMTRRFYTFGAKEERN